jgi:hypothetical protein
MKSVAIVVTDYDAMAHIEHKLQEVVDEVSYLQSRCTVSEIEYKRAISTLDIQINELIRVKHILELLSQENVPHE